MGAVYNCCWREFSTIEGTGNHIRKKHKISFKKLEASPAAVARAFNCTQHSEQRQADLTLSPALVYTEKSCLRQKMEAKEELQPPSAQMPLLASLSFFRVSLGCAGAHYVDQASLNLQRSMCLCLLNAGLKGHASPSSPFSLLWLFFCVPVSGLPRP